ncbi:tRNA (uridine(54)-C5)-methyltransferase TrmA [Corallincola luteus]|uniref:tRNA/tmRNA (uracil-C(5))-methyltransferase n=2 Tax=Corallincola TaxID=1775176 RepID=A0A368NMP0_9GAMM|nr:MULTISPECIES: tRNA (uridine(54)-C5)-methyltransferase TrmA [Corallincola]RCU51153.1 tRNA (uridine(54)-C5)-methyltransferase TrmA [Corallincola holothuriorum]TCI01448.1 tRNA (uridine(54)-C5)-methyltransferase TrmA [Corallincola luteus]
MAELSFSRSEYDAQLADKSRWLTETFNRFSPPTLELFASAPSHYRMRAEFRVWHDGDDLDYIMFDKGTRNHYKVTSFPQASQLINELMTALLNEIKGQPILRRKLFQVDFLSSQTGEATISLLYHRQLDTEWEAAATQLQQTLQHHGKVELIGRARKQKIVLARDYVMETLTVGDKPFHYQQIENSFTQPNAGVCEKMLNWAVDTTKEMSGDLLELYCGNGNFTLPLAQNFRKVLATEIAKPSVASAQLNMKLNQVDNVTVIRMSSEEFTEAMAGRKFNRLAGVDLSSYECNTIFVDPPRSGLDPETVNLVRGYDNILYISCNPETLAENLEQLIETHEISRFALFDQFPYTHHCEAGVLLTRRQ